MRSLCAIFLFLGSLTGMAQQYPKSALIEDLRFLADAVENGHPASYQRGTPILGSYADSISAVLPDSLTPFVYRAAIAGALEKVGCAHTSIKKMPYLDALPVRYFPLDLYWVEGKLLHFPEHSVHKNDSITEIIEISEINGKGIYDFLPDLWKYKASDGPYTSFGRGVFEWYPNALIAHYFNRPEEYKIRYRILNGNGQPLEKKLKAVDTFRGTPALPYVYQDTLATSKKSDLYAVNDSILVLNIDHFDGNILKINAKAAKLSKKGNIQHIVFDIRGNTGGSRSVLVKFLETWLHEPASYDIIRYDDLKPRKYLPRKGKTQLAFSKLQYMRGKRKGTGAEKGKYFHVKIKPKHSNHTIKLHVIVDGISVSSASMAASYLKEKGGAKIYGEMTGGGAYQNYGGSFPQIKLPVSKTTIVFPVYRLDYHLGEGSDAVLPQSTLRPTLTGWYLNKDTVMEETILSIQGKKRAFISKPLNRN